MKLRHFLVAMCSMLLICPSALPWGDEGHQLVGRIAARKLQGNAPANIVLLLRSDPNDDLGLKKILKKSGPPPAGALETALKTIATWPDNMPGGKGPTAPWHFVDIGLFEGPSHIDERCPGGACVNQKITELIQNLKSKQSLTVSVPGKPQKVFTPPKELRFLVHFLGDIHQPLHAATNADAGANCLKETGFQLQFPEVHAVWDTALVQEVIGKSPADVAGAIIQEFDEKLTVPEADPKAIAGESFGIATGVYKAATPPVPVIDRFVDVIPGKCDAEAPPEINAVTVDARASYDKPEMLLIVRQQLYKAGVRLAAILNTIYDHP